MEPTPRIPSSDEADPDVQSSPAGLSEELEREADERNVEVGPDADDRHGDDSDDPVD
ncbi:MAG TPA: hypothetical protein VK917_04145 [Ilumatobacter sp.]|nr:hypothetical protein [Ilumatobacter sp.]